LKRKLLKIIVGSLFVSLFIVAVIVILSFKVITSTFGNYEGKIKVKGINNKVQIFRDSLGIPYIYAKNEIDAAFAMGFVHAQERMFQMDLLRRAAMGRLSEIIGSKGIKFDQMFRTLKLYKKSKENYAGLNERLKTLLKAYSKGVNQYLKTHKASKSIEFDILNYAPFKWTPAQTIAIGKLIAWELNMGWWSKVITAHLLNKFPLKYAGEIIPVDKNTRLNSNRYGMAAAMNLIELNREFKEFFGMEGSHLGSNNWAISGKLSVDGKPIIANDVHLFFSLPNIWYAVSLHEGNYSPAGFTIPGLPFVLIGSNGSVAWSSTNLMSDDAQFFLEKIDSNKTNYFYRGKWMPLQTEEEIIRVKDSADVKIKIFSTKNGILLNGLHPYNILFRNDAQEKINISMHWDALEEAGSIYSYYLINRSKNIKELINALKYFDYPGQNFIFTDKGGNICYALGVKLRSFKKDDYPLIFKGWEANRLPPFVKFEKMPLIINPASQFLATANNKIAQNFPFHIADLWEPPARISRIKKMLLNNRKFSAKNFIAMQNDYSSDYFKPILKALQLAFKKVTIKDANLKLALKLLEKWNYQFDKFSQPPAIFSLFYQKLLRNTFLDEMGKNLFNEYVFIANIPFRIMNKLIEKPRSYWWDDKNTIRIEDRDFILRKSFSEALDFLEKRFGKNIALWQWGKLHKLILKHPFHGKNAIINKVLDRGPFEVNGSGVTLFNTEYSFIKPFNAILGQTVRFVYDFANPDEISFAMPGGESGHVFNSHYSDLTNKWLKAGSFKLKINLSKIEKKGMKKLVLLTH